MVDEFFIVRLVGLGRGLGRSEALEQSPDKTGLLLRNLN